MGLQMISVLSYRKQGFPFLFNIFFIKEKLRKQTFESRPNTEQAIGENIYKHNEKNEVMSAQEYKKNLKQYLLEYKSEWDERIKKPKAKHNKTILEYIFTI